MKAELSKASSMIRFVWTSADDKEERIQVLRFNLTFSENYYYENYMGRENARKYWNTLVGYGFSQATTCAIL